MFRKIFTIILSLVVFTGCASVPSNTGSEIGAYDNYVAKLKSGDTNIDYMDFRIAYTKTSNYNPYGVFGSDEKKKKSLEYFEKKKFKKAVKTLEPVLDSDYTDIMAHFFLSLFYEELKNTDKANFHLSISRGLMRSIVESGSGKSAKEAMTVISVREEYVTLQGMGFSVKSQALVEDNGSAYDAMTVVDDETGEEKVFYFNVDIPFNSLSDKLGE